MAAADSGGLLRGRSARRGCDEWEAGGRRGFFCRARAMAEGLLGPAYRKASEYQRLEWIDMCERALREASQP